MLASTEYYRRGTGSVIPRIFVDVTTSLMLAGQETANMSRVEGEIALRLLLFSNFNFIPVVFGNDGLLFALSPEQVTPIFSSKPITNSQENRPRKQVSPAAKKCETAKEGNARRRPGTLPLRLKVRHAALVLVAWMPQAVREDVRAILIRARQLARTIISQAVREDVSAILIHARRIVRTIIYRNPGSLAASIPARLILSALQVVVHPRSGDVLWTAGPYSNFVPLRTIGEMRARSGLRVVTTCDDVIRMTHPQFNPTSIGSELLTADAVALLDASDLVLAVSERTQRELSALAARSGRKPPAVQVLQTGSELRQLLDPDNEESPTIPEAMVQPNLAIAVPDTLLWDEVAAAVKERLQMLAAEIDAG